MVSSEIIPHLEMCRGLWRGVGVKAALMIRECIRPLDAYSTGVLHWQDMAFAVDPSNHGVNQRMTQLRQTEVVLTDLPNVGRAVARLLLAAGIRTPDDLRRVGALAAAARIARVRPHDPPCRSMLAGLEGAIRGARWHTIPKAERDALWNEYRVRTTPSSRRATRSRAARKRRPRSGPGMTAT